MRKRISGLLSFLVATTIVMTYLTSVTYADIEYDEDYDVGSTGSWTWAAIMAEWPPRYYNFFHNWQHDFAPGYWGPPPYVDVLPGNGESNRYGYTKIKIFVYQGGNFIEEVMSEAWLPPPD